MPLGGVREGAGRKPGSVSAATLAIRELAKEHSERAMQVLVDIMRGDDMPAAARISAAKEVLERAHGKSANFVSTVFDPPLSKLSPEDALAAIIDKVTNGDLFVDEGSRLTGMIEARIRAVELSQLDHRLKALEE